MLVGAPGVSVGRGLAAATADTVAVEASVGFAPVGIVVDAVLGVDTADGATGRELAVALLGLPGGRELAVALLGLPGGRGAAAGAAGLPS